MKVINKFLAVSVMALGIACLLCGCSSKDSSSEYYSMEMVQDNTAKVLWNPEDFNFEDANLACLKRFAKMAEDKKAAGACTSWRNGNFHGRNLDWYQADYGCIILQMPKGGTVKHASVALLNSSTIVTQDFLKKGEISEENRAFLPCTVVDGINDAGIAVNINIVPHDPSNEFIDEEGDLSSQCVVRYVLDNAGSVGEAISLLEHRKVRQSIVNLAGDETHYMISGKDTTAVVEFKNKEMVVTYFYQQPGKTGYYSQNGNPAIMTNLYDCDVEKYGIGTPEFLENCPYSMGIERWNAVKAQYDNAAKSVDENLKIAESVWYFKNFMAEKTKWYTENALPSSWGKDDNGWYYSIDGRNFPVADCPAAQEGFWNGYMASYWKEYETKYGSLKDPHVHGNMFWETSHTVIYDLKEKKGYVCPFENFYSTDGKPIEMILP